MGVRPPRPDHPPSPPGLPGGGAAVEPRPSLIPLYYKRVKGDGLDFIEVQRHHIFTFFFLWVSLPPLHPPAQPGKTPRRGDFGAFLP